MGFKFHKGLSRRSAILMLGSAAVAARPVAAAVQGKEIVVIGAGLSGLAAARALKVGGAKVTVLEARDRIGGRIWTSRLWPDLPMDLGASWIHGTEDNPVSELADAAGAKRLATSYENSLSFDGKGNEIDLDKQYGEAEAIVDAARKAAEQLEADVSLAEAVRQSAAWKAASAGERRAVRGYVNDHFEQEYGGSWSELSAWHFDEGEEFDGQDVLFPGGYDQITNHLARGLDIRTGAAATYLAPVRDGVRVGLASGEVMRADHAVVTVPLGVLQAGRIRFEAKLAPAREKAIATLKMGLLNKCWLRFDEVAWPDDVDWITWAGPKDGVWAQWVSLARAASAPVLLGFHAGAQAREMERLDDGAMAAAAHEALKAMFGSAFPAPRAAQVTRWSQDEFTLGSYSFNAVGTTQKTRPALAGSDWDGRLVFAGEATSRDHFGTAHGAVLSGRDAAKALTEV